MSTKYKESNIFALITAIIAILSMVTTCNLTKRQISQSSSHFESTIKRDSLLNLAESDVVEKQLQLAKIQNRILDKQNEILDKSFRMDSLLQSRQLGILRKEYSLKLKERSINQELNLNQLNNFLLDFILNMKIMPNEVIAMSEPEIANWFKAVNERMEVEIKNPILTGDKEILKTWRRVMDNNKLQILTFSRIDFSKKTEEVRKERKISAWEITVSGLEEIYNSVNEKYGNDTFIKVRN